MFKKLLQKLTVRNTLYYPGCLTKYSLPQIRENYEKILKKIGVDYIMLKELELCCGSPAIRGGYNNDFNNIKKKNLELFDRYGVAKIVTNCPACYHVFKEEYGLEVEHITSLVAKKIDRFDKGKFNERISYHDPCHLGRYSGIYEEPRQVLRALGFEVVELRNHNEQSLCCGGGGGLKSNNPDVANKIAKLRLKQVKTSKIITPCPMCYVHLKENAKGIEVLEFSEVLV